MRLVKLWISVIALFSVTAFGLTGCGGGGGGGGTPIIPVGTAPAAPTGVAAAALNNTQVGLNWGAVTGATSYNVYWSTTAGLPKEQRTKIAVAAPPFTHSNLQSGAKYYYVVTAVNSAGESDPSAEVSATTTVSPTAVSATPANAQVTLAWPEVAGASSYNVYFSTSSNMIPASSTKVPNAARTGQIITPLVNGTPYFFEVTAVINGVESDPSAIVSAVPSTTPAPAAPFLVQSSSLVFGGQPQISVAWGDVPNAATYNVYYSTTPNVSKTNFAGSFINAQTSVVNGLRTFHPAVTDQATTTYYFIVTAVDAGGNESTASPVLKVIPPIFTQVMVSGKTVTYRDATNGTPNGKTFTFVANPNGTLTFVSTLTGVPASGTGSWAILADGSLQVLIPNGSLTFNYDIFQTTNNGNLVRVQFNNGSQLSAGDMTFS